MKRALLAVVLSLSCLSLVHAQDETDRAEEALGLMQSGEVEAALRLLDELVAKNPRHGYARLLRGMCHLDLRAFEAAERDASAAFELDPSDGRAVRVRGSARREMGDLAAALQDFDRALELDGGDLVAVSERGYTKYLMRDFAGAIADASKVLASDGGSAFALEYRGWARAQSGDLPGAAQDMREALTHAPNPYFAFFAHAFGGDASQLTRVVAIVQGWTRALHDYHTGKLTPEQLLAEARRAEDPAAVPGQLCEAHCYIALQADYRAKDPALARKHYEACVATGVRGFVEYQYARLRLEGMPKVEKATCAACGAEKVVGKPCPACGTY